MPVHINQIIEDKKNIYGYDIAKILEEQVILQFAAVRPAKVGIGSQSCCAAFAIEPASEYPAIEGQNFAVSFGNSQIAVRGLDQPGVGKHAEICAITNAVNNKLYSLDPAILYVELKPCKSCEKWLKDYYDQIYHNKALKIKDLYVWYSFNYNKEGIDRMEKRNNLYINR